MCDEHVTDAVDPALKLAIKRRQRNRGKRRLARTPRPPSPVAQERRYSNAIIRAIDPLIVAIREELFPNLEGLVSQAESELITADASTDDLQRLLSIVRVRFGRVFTDQRVEETIERTQESIDNENRRTFQRQTKTVLGIDPVMAEPWLDDVLKSHAVENASLIKSLPEETLSDIQEISLRALRRGDSPANVRKQILERWETTEGRAKVIGRDQVSKLNASLTESRQVALGVTRYEWLTSRDSRVRRSHRQRDGIVFEWGKPIEPQLRAKGLIVDTIDGPPGIPIQCRCNALPILSDLV